MKDVYIVTDSTADIPEDMVAQWDITVVPAYVQIEGQSYADGNGFNRERFYESLPTLRSQPTTSAPSIGDFAAAYQKLADQAKELVVLTVSSAFSSVYHVAQLAARAVAKPRVHVVDSQMCSMGHGWLTIAAAEAAAAGAGVNDILALIEGMQPRVHVCAALDTVDYLRRSGRVSWAKAAAAQVLRIRPIVRVVAGRAQECGRTRTARQAVERLVDFVESLGPLERLAVLHTGAPNVEQLLTRLTAVLPRMQPLTAVASSAIGAHLGPRAMGVAAVSAP